MNIEVVLNRNFNKSKPEHLENYKSSNINRVVDFHKDLGNKETPLYELPSLAKYIGVRKLFVKDESSRLGLKSFKVLGASYAMKMELERNPQIRTFITATDGNHGKAVAWMAKILNKNSIVYKQNYNQGSVIGIEDLEFRCPGDGLEPYHLDLVIGRTLKLSVKEHQCVEIAHLA